MKPKEESMREALRRAVFTARGFGIEEVHDYVDEELAELYLSLEEELPLRVVLMPYHEHYRGVVDLLKERGPEKLSLGWVKVFVDGSVGARTAYLKEPYEDRKDSRGLLLRSAEELTSMLKELESEDLRASFHAIGDGAVEECLVALERAKPELKFHRIEHALLLDREQALRAKELNVLFCIQPNFKPFFRETYLKALGEERFRYAVPLKLLDSLGVDMVFGSDMMPFDPSYGLGYAREVLGREKAEYYYSGWRKVKDYL